MDQREQYVRLAVDPGGYSNRSFPPSSALSVPPSPPFLALPLLPLLLKLFCHILTITLFPFLSSPCRSGRHLPIHCPCSCHRPLGPPSYLSRHRFTGTLLPSSPSPPPLLPLSSPSPPPLLLSPSPNFLLRICFCMKTFPMPKSSTTAVSPVSFEYTQDWYYFFLLSLPLSSSSSLPLPLLLLFSFLSKNRCMGGILWHQILSYQRGSTKITWMLFADISV